MSGRGDESNWHRAASFLHLLQPIPLGFSTVPSVLASLLRATVASVRVLF